MLPVYYTVSDHPRGAPEYRWRVSRGRRLCLVCDTRHAAVEFAVESARDDMTTNRLSVVQVREGDGYLRVIWTARHAMRTRDERVIA